MDVLFTFHSCYLHFLVRNYIFFYILFGSFKETLYICPVHSYVMCDEG